MYFFALQEISNLSNSDHRHLAWRTELADTFLNENHPNIPF
jgi:hypothetical protein